MKHWTHGINSSGPDWYFDATVNQPADILIDSTDLPGYRHYAAIEQHGLITQTLGCHHWYIDSSHFEQLIHNATVGARAQNLWNFACILFEENHLQIRRGYGFGDEIHASTETRLMRSLFDNPALQLTAWQISAGGNGYRFTTIAAGKSKTDLVAYLS